MSNETAEIHPSTTATSGSEHSTDTAQTQDEQLVHETLVEEVSIDGMCGVY